jgi:hypothetical protein
MGGDAMTDNCSPTRDPGQTPLEGLHDRARQEVLAAVQRIVRDTGGQFVTRPLVSGEPDGPTTRDAEPLAGLRTARAAELAARGLARRYVRAAREDGHSWTVIGAALSLPSGGYVGAGETIAEAAFRYAAGPADSHWTRTYGPSVTWRCPACGGLVSDHGPASGPHDDEPGHNDGCQRLAAAIAAWEASWADEEAGQ